MSSLALWIYNWFKIIFLGINKFYISCSYPLLYYFFFLEKRKNQAHTPKHTLIHNHTLIHTFLRISAKLQPKIKSDVRLHKAKENNKNKNKTEKKKKKEKERKGFEESGYKFGK